MVAVAQGMQVCGAGPGVPHAPMPSVDVKPDLARHYSQHRVTGRAGLAPCRGSCAHPARGLLTLPCHSWPDGKMSSACSACSVSSAHGAHSASSGAQPGWQPGPSAMAPQQAGHHTRARQGSGGILLPMGDTAPGGARQGQPGLLPSPALPHGSVVPSTPQLSHFLGDLGIAMPCPGWAQPNAPACAGRLPFHPGVSCGAAFQALAPSCLQGLPVPPCTCWSTRV